MTLLGGDVVADLLVDQVLQDLAPGLSDQPALLVSDGVTGLAGDGVTLLAGDWLAVLSVDSLAVRLCDHLQHRTRDQTLLLLLPPDSWAGSGTAAPARSCTLAPPRTCRPARTLQHSWSAGVSQTVPPVEHSW